MRHLRRIRRVTTAFGVVTLGALAAGPVAAAIDLTPEESIPAATSEDDVVDTAEVAEHESVEEPSQEASVVSEPSPVSEPSIESEPSVESVPSVESEPSVDDEA